jgi:hypothetical protein
MNKLIKKSYKWFLIEKSYLKNRIETFNSNIETKGIPDSLKEISINLSNQLIEVPSIKKIDFLGYNFYFNIKYGVGYSSAINFMDLIKTEDNKIKINLNVPNNYDKDYLNSTIIHELRHCLVFLDENQSADTSSFIIDMNRHNFNDGLYFEFMKLIYISLEHELVARNNQIYPYIKFKNLTKDDSIKILKSSFIWSCLKDLKNFDVKNFINKFNTDELLNITNRFIENCLQDLYYKINDIDGLYYFYNTWNDYFIMTSNNWELEMFKEVDRLYEKSLFERLDNNIIQKLIKDIWKDIKNY